MASRSGMIVFDGIGPVLDYLVLSTVDNVVDEFARGAEEIEWTAQMNAPWSDITGAARAGLIAEVYNDWGVAVIELAHSVDYGIWLELIQDGRFAIIMPTLEALGPEIIEDAGGMVVPGASGF